MATRWRYRGLIALQVNYSRNSIPAAYLSRRFPERQPLFRRPSPRLPFPYCVTLWLRVTRYRWRPVKVASFVGIPWQRGSERTRRAFLGRRRRWHPRWRRRDVSRRVMKQMGAVESGPVVCGILGSISISNATIRRRGSSPANRSCYYLPCVARERWYRPFDPLNVSLSSARSYDGRKCNST